MTAKCQGRKADNDLCDKEVSCPQPVAAGATPLVFCEECREKNDRSHVDYTKLKQEEVFGKFKWNDLCASGISCTQSDPAFNPVQCVCCATCPGWFHRNCVPPTSTYTKTKLFLCPTCASSNWLGALDERLELQGDKKPQNADGSVKPEGRGQGGVGSGKFPNESQEAYVQRLRQQVDFYEAEVARQQQMTQQQQQLVGMPPIPSSFWQTRPHSAHLWQQQAAGAFMPGFTPNVTYNPALPGLPPSVMTGGKPTGPAPQALLPAPATPTQEIPVEQMPTAKQLRTLGFDTTAQNAYSVSHAAAIDIGWSQDSTSKTARATICGPTHSLYTRSQQLLVAAEVAAGNTTLSGNLVLPRTRPSPDAQLRHFQVLQYRHSRYPDFRYNAIRQQLVNNIGIVMAFSNALTAANNAPDIVIDCVTMLVEDMSAAAYSGAPFAPDSQALQGTVIARVLTARAEETLYRAEALAAKDRHSPQPTRKRPQPERQGGQQQRQQQQQQQQQQSTPKKRKSPQDRTIPFPGATCINCGATDHNIKECQGKGNTCATACFKCFMAGDGDLLHWMAKGSCPRL